MNDTGHSFWDRLADRTKVIGPLATLEDPKAVVRVATGTVWGGAISAVGAAALFFAFDEPVAAVIALVLAGVYMIGWTVYAATGSLLAQTAINVAAASAAIVLVHLDLGGYANSGAFLFWTVGLTVAALLVLGRNGGVGLGVIYTIAAIALGLLESTLAGSRGAPDATLSTLLFVGVLVGSLVLLAPVLLYVLGRLSQERERAEGLLLNVLPAVVAAELKETGATTARRFDAVSVLFADIVGFTPMSAEMEPEEMVDRLNDVFTAFDTLAQRYGVEKIRTIGDNYMVASGVPVARDDHAQALSAMALDMLVYAQDGPLSFRIGINSGPAVAGVIGTSKFQYDIWGDTVNTASRMESHGEPGRIQISDATKQLIKNDFATAPRGSIEVKGKGSLQTHWLESALHLATAETR